MECCKKTIRNAVTTALGNAAENLLDDIVNLITEVVGVESEDDLKLLTEQDLVPMLKPIQARKVLFILQKETLQEISTQVTPPESSAPPTPTSTMPLMIKKVQISWSQMPKKLMNALKSKSVPSPSLRREMVRIVAGDILEFTSSPNRSFCREIAREIVSDYPESFLDKVCGQVLANGYESLTGQLINRCENLRRNQTKTRKEGEPSEAPSIAVPRKRKIVDSYGCVNWNPQFPGDNNIESLAEKKEELKHIAPDDFDLMKKLMEETFCIQRDNINGGQKMSELLVEWPNLFTEVGLHHHFQLLTDINLEQKLTSSHTRSSDYFKFFASLKNKKLEMLIKIIETKNDVNEALGLLHAISTYFEEDISKFILTSEVCDPHNMEHTSLLPEAPCLIAIGTDALTANSYMLIIDKTVVNSNVSSLAAITAYFAVYYIFNIRYPDELKITLEFMQRCFFGINPTSGSKINMKKGKKCMAINPKILAFCQKLQHNIFFQDERQDL